jgi:hypothetical protein
MRLQFGAGGCVLAALMGAAGTAEGGFISDVSFFNDKPTALINFEQDAMGNAITLIQGQRLTMPTDAYAPVGVEFVGTGSPVYWVNDGNAAFDAAQTLGASPTVSIPSSLTNTFTINFTVNVRAFAFFVANNRLADAVGPVFVARDASGNVLETATWGAPFVDGTITIPNTTADYGIMGIFTSVPIASVTISKQAAILDDLRYSSVPAPGAVVLAGIGAVMVGARRRRS